MTQYVVKYFVYLRTLTRNLQNIIETDISLVQHQGNHVHNVAASKFRTPRVIMYYLYGAYFVLMCKSYSIKVGVFL